MIKLKKRGQKLYSSLAALVDWGCCCCCCCVFEFVDDDELAEFELGAVLPGSCVGFQREEADPGPA